MLARLKTMAKRNVPRKKFSEKHEGDSPNANNARMVRRLIHGVNDMAKTKKKKAKKASKAVKAKKAPAKKKAAKKTKAKRVKAKAGPAKKKVVKAAAKKAAPKKAAAKKPASKAKKRPIGEGDYEASRAFLKDQAGFVRKNKASIPELGKQAEMALDGPEGTDLKAAEAEAASHSKAAE